jgi:nucleoside triphosphatase
LSQLANSRDQVFPEPTVGGLVVNKEGKILLVSSHKWFDKLTIPGGHVELGETMRDAVVREVKEEVGLGISVVRLLLTQEAIYTSQFWKKRHYIFFDFLCRSETDTVKLDNREIQGYSWAWPGEALRMNLETFTRNVVEKYLGPNI